MQLPGSTNKKYILAQTSAETTKNYFHKHKIFEKFRPKTETLYPDKKFEFWVFPQVNVLIWLNSH
jgi:hypothetical protein